jgi:hypothetical protein
MGSAVRVLRLPIGLMGAVVLLTYGAIVWTLPRGFDWTDEAFIYTMTASNRVAVGEPWGFQHLLHPLYVLTGESVLAFRILRLAGYVGLSLALVGCARAVAGRLGISLPRAGWVFVLLLAQVGTFLAWSYPAHHLGYNELASWFAQLGVALIVGSLAWGVSAPTESPSRTQRDLRLVWSIWAGLGGVTTLLVFTKVTSGLAMLALVLLAVGIPNPYLPLRKRFLAAATGTLTVLLLLWVWRYPMVSYAQNVSALLFDPSAREAFDHPVSELFDTYARSLTFTGRALVPVLVIFALAMATFRRRAARPLTGEGGWSRPGDVITWTLGAVLLTAVIALPRVVASAPMTRPQMWSYVGVLTVFIGAAGLIGLATLGADGAVLHGSTVIRRVSVAVAGTAIVAAPFVMAAGTNNRLAGEFCYAATLWAVVLGIALVRLTQRATTRHSSARILPALVGCVVVLLGGLAVRADIAKPYRTAPLMSQGTSSTVPELRGLLLTEAEAAWIGWVDDAGDSLGAQGVPAAAIDAPGALFAFNRSGYANPWISHTAPASLSSLRQACTSHPPADLFVLQPGTQPGRAPSVAAVTRSLAGCGLSFPGDFRVVGRRVSARPGLAITLWRVKNGWRPAQGAAR